MVFYLSKADSLILDHFQLQPWNVDTISKPGFEKSILNLQPKRIVDNLTEEEREEKMRQFIKTHEKEMKHYGMLQKFGDSKQYLMEHSHLASEEMANYLVIWCVNLQMEKVRIKTMFLFAIIGTEFLPSSFLMIHRLQSCKESHIISNAFSH